MAAGWIAGSEILWKGGKKVGKKAMDAYLLSLVRQNTRNPRMGNSRDIRQKPIDIETPIGFTDWS